MIAQDSLGEHHSFSFYLTKFLNAKVKKTDPFSARFPHQNIVPFFPRPTGGRPRKKKSGLSKGAENVLKLVKLEMPKYKKLTKK